jgi:hypothetical protein
MQTPYLDEVNSQVEPVYSCVHNWGFMQGSGMGDMLTSDVCAQQDPATGETVTVDCAKLNLCMFQVCQCRADGCYATEIDDSAPPSIEFDGALEDGGDELVGTLVLAGERLTVRMRRQ